MARQRTIDPGFFRNEDLAELPFEARLLFAGLWTQADREGRLEDRPKRIKGDIFPHDAVDVDALLDSLVGMIRRYRVGDIRVIDIPSWHKFQHCHPREKPSVLPGFDLAEPESGTSRGKVSPRRTLTMPGKAIPSKPSYTSGSSGSSDSVPSTVHERFTDEIRQLFSVEVESRQGKGTAMLTSKRTKAGVDRLRQGYPLDEAKDAIRACCADDWCRRTANDNMAYALKDGDTLEKFCRVWRQSQPTRRQLPPADEER